MRRALSPIVFDDEGREAAAARRHSVAEPARRSPSSVAKAARKLTADGARVPSFRSLLADLATIGKNRIRPKTRGGP